VNTEDIVKGKKKKRKTGGTVHVRPPRRQIDDVSDQDETQPLFMDIFGASSSSSSFAFSGPRHFLLAFALPYKPRLTFEKERRRKAGEKGGRTERI
jgi:hypothetical protein